MAPRRQSVQAARYVSQFDPGAQDLTQRILQERSNRFEQSFAGLQAEQAKQGEIFFLDEQAKQNTLGRFNAEKDDILKKYNNDYEAAAPELSKLIVKERNNPIYNLNKYQQGKVQEYQQQVNRIGAGNVIEISKPDTSLTDEQGNVKDPSAFDYEIYDKSKLQTKGAQWLSQIKSTERPLKLTEDGQFYEQVSEITQEDFMSNLTDEKMAKFLETAPELARLAEVNNHDPIEFARQYLISEGQGMVGVHKRGYLQNKDYLSAKDKAILEAKKAANTVAPGVISSAGLFENNKNFTHEDFTKNSINTKFNFNWSHKFIEPDFDPLLEYTKGNINHAEAQSMAIERAMLREDKELRNLYEKASVTDEELGKLKGKGFAYNLAYADRLEVRNDYSNMLANKSEAYIASKGFDADYNINFYEPDFTNAKSKIAYNNWATSGKEGFNQSDQFTFLNGDNAGKSIKEVNEAYGVKNAEKLKVLSVGGNEIAGLIWKVVNPDGTISDATWNTGFEKQMNYVRDIIKQPELVESLKASALSFDETGSIITTMPDVPSDINKAIRDNELYIEEDLENTDPFYYLKSGDYYLYIDPQSQTIKTTKDKQGAMPKALMFDVIKSLNI